MNLRCFYCQTPFTLGRVEILAALQRMDSENMNHYDAHCPRCRRANSVARQRLEMFLPNWREVAAEQVAVPASAAESAPMTVMPSEEPAPKANKSHRKRAGSAKAAEAKPAARTTKKPAATKAKPAAKSTTASREKKTTTKNKK